MAGIRNYSVALKKKMKDGTEADEPLMEIFASSGSEALQLAIERCRILNPDCIFCWVCRVYMGNMVHEEMP